MAAALAAGYCILAVASAKLFYSGSAATGLWAANAFAVGFLLRAQFRSLGLAAAVVAVSALASNIVIGHTAIDIATYSAANFIGILTGYGLVRNRFPDWRVSVGSARNYALTLALAGGLAPGLGGAVFSLARSAMSGDPYLSTWWLWCSGDALGHAVILPIILLGSRERLAALGARVPLTRSLTALVVVVAIAAAAAAGTSFPFLIVLVPLMAAAAFLPPMCLAVTCAAAGLTVIGVVAMGYGPENMSIELMAPYRFQISLAISVVLPLLGGLVIDQTRADRRRIAESEQRFRRAMMDSAIGVAIVALDGRIVEANRAFAGMIDYTVDELALKAFFELTHPGDLDVGAEVMAAVRSGQADSYHFEKRYIRKDGSAVWCEIAGSVIRSAETGQPLYLVSQIQDIDQRKKAAAALAEAETRWNFALAAAGQGVWDLDLQNGKVTYSSTWKQMLGYDEHELDGDPDQWLTLVHPDDRERVVQADLDHAKGLTPMFQAEFRMRHKEGHWLWILDRGQIVKRNPDGSVARAIGTLTDITMRREAEDQLVSYTTMLADEKERLRVTLNAIGDAVICTDAENRITFMNPVAEKLTRAVEQNVLGKPLASVYRSIDEETGERLVPSASAGADTRQNSRAVLVREDGTRCSIREVVSRIENDKGEFGGSVIVFQDFTDARTLQRELAYAAAHDALTGLANRSSFIQRMEAMAADPVRRLEDGQFLFIDLDRFKAVNDTGGHAAGDALLKRVADAIKTLVRPGDVVARLGGDEFAAILKPCTSREAEAIANRIVGAIGTLDFVWSGRRYDVGASIGVAPLSMHDTEIDEIIARADEACYSAKASGRNCVAIFDSDMAGRAARDKKVAIAS